jgi:ankyrin repeat protein
MQKVQPSGKHLEHALGSLALREDGVAGLAAEAGSCSDEAKDDNGMTVLLRAASDNNWEEVRKLMLGGADPSVADGQGLTAMHYASLFGSMELTQTLIAHGPAGLVFPRSAEWRDQSAFGLPTRAPGDCKGPDRGGRWGASPQDKQERILLPPCRVP